MLPFLVAAAVSLQDTGLADARALFAAGRLAAARAAAEQLVRDHPRDEANHLLLGRIWLAWPTFGRYQALAEFQAAARLAPDDPEPLYGELEVGERLGSDEGDRLMREAAIAILARTPAYRDVWDVFESVYHDRGIWERADAALASHPDDPTALEHRTELALDLDAPERADSLAARVLARAPDRVSALLLRTEAAFARGADSAGYAWYDSAVAHADLDSTGALWGTVWMIASPAEVARQDSTPPEARAAFFRWFWARRDPNLVTPWNERIAEHFRRLAYVQAQFRLLHPQSRFQRSALRRAVIYSYLGDEMQAYAESVDAAVPALVPHLGARYDSLLFAHRVGVGPEDVARDTGQRTVSSLAGVDARGLVYVRYGPPDAHVIGDFDPITPVTGGRGVFEIEGWGYHTPAGELTIGFQRATAGAPGFMGGDFIFRPVSPAQVRSARILLTSDRTAIPAPLDARIWSAVFRHGDTWRTDVYLKTAPDTAAAVLWDSTWDVVARGRGPGLVTLTVDAGAYRLGVDVDSAGALGRHRGELVVPRFGSGVLALSSLVVAPGTELADRAAALAGMPADLVYPSGTPLVTYAEIYGLAEDANGASHYSVRYSFAPVRGGVAGLLGQPRPVTFEFTRVAPARVAQPERLVIDPGRLAPGRYRVTVAVTDDLRNVKSAPVGLAITVR